MYSLNYADIGPVRYILRSYYSTNSNYLTRTNVCGAIWANIGIRKIPVFRQKVNFLIFFITCFLNIII